MAGRYGLVRPVTGRYLAGVCAGLGRATNTDPVLWRVLIGVLALFGGVGLVFYILGWLLTPAEGDTASPVEALVGRGRSRTSPYLVVLVGIGGVVMLMLVLSDSFYAAVLGVAVVIGAILLANRSSRTAPTVPPPAPDPPYAGPPPPQPPAPQGAHETQVTAMQPASPSVPPPAAPPGGYRPPFAPYGPYGGPPPPPPAPPVPPQPKPPKERSPLGQIILSLACVAVGILAAVDVATGRVEVSAYFAAILGVIGAGLLVGAWLGRARLLIIVGLLVAAGLGISSGVESADPIRFEGGNVRWHPTSLDELAVRYDLGAGDAVLDLTDLDFTGQDREVTVSVSFGSLRVLLPRDVDTEVHVDMGAGDANVFGHTWGGFNQKTRDISDLGEDGLGGGHLRLNLDVKAGELEVTR
jgi:phage shock protein PspC (stress-responsive transcriptional regulator)